MGTISKLNDIAWATNISKLNDISGIAKVNDQDIPSTGTGIKTTDLIQYWDFADSSFYSGSGTGITDLSDPTKTGSLVGGTAVTTSGSATYGDFDGVNDYAECSIVNTFGSNHTCEMWFRMPNLTDGIKRMMFVRSYKSDCVNLNGGYALQFDPPNRQIMFTPMGVTLYRSNAVASSLSTSSWYHMAAVASGGTLSFYWQGSLVNTNTSFTTLRYPPCATGLVCRTNALSGNTGAVNTSFCTEADLAELRIYTTNLTAQEISNNFDATKSRYGY